MLKEKIKSLLCIFQGKYQTREGVFVLLTGTNRHVHFGPIGSYGRNKFPVPFGVELVILWQVPAAAGKIKEEDGCVSGGAVVSALLFFCFSFAGVRTTLTCDLRS